MVLTFLGAVKAIGPADVEGYLRHVKRRRSDFHIGHDAKVPPSYIIEHDDGHIEHGHEFLDRLDREASTSCMKR